MPHARVRKTAGILGSRCSPHTSSERRITGAQAPASVAQDDTQYPQYPGEAVRAGLGGLMGRCESDAAPGISVWSIHRGGNAGLRRVPGVRCPDPTSLGTDLARDAAPGRGVGGAGATWRNPYRTGCWAHASAKRAPSGKGFVGAAWHASLVETLSSSKTKGSSGQNSWRLRSSDRACDKGSSKDARDAAHATSKHQEPSAAAAMLLVLPTTIGAPPKPRRDVGGNGLIGVEQKRYAGVEGTAAGAGDTQVNDGDSPAKRRERKALSADLRQAASGRSVSHSRSSLPAVSSAERSVDGAVVGH